MFNIIETANELMCDIYIPKYKALIEKTQNNLIQKGINKYYITVNFNEGGFIIEEIDSTDSTNITQLHSFLEYLGSCIHDYITFKIKYHNYCSEPIKQKQIKNTLIELFEPEILEYITLVIEPCSKYVNII